MALTKIDSIVVGERLRGINDEKVEQLMTSIKDTGLLSPVIICGNQLIAGHHRLEACKRLGHDQIPTTNCGDANNPDSTKLIEIDENLFRNELSPAEHSAHIAQRVEVLARLKAKEILPLKVEAYRKKKNTSRPLSDKVSHDLDVKSKKTAKAEAVKETAETFATAPTHISATIRDHTAVTDADLDQNELKDLNGAQYKQVAKAVRGLDPEAAKAELDKVLNCQHSASNDDEWYTPAIYVEAARRVLGVIDVDPASNPVAQQTVKAAKYYTIDDSGLDHDWIGNVFLNPPYSSVISEFANKIVNERKVGNITSAIVLTNNNGDTEWWSTMLSASTGICVTDFRIAFEKKDGVPRKGNSKGQCFFYVGDNYEAFRREFDGVHGNCLPSHCLKGMGDAHVALKSLLDIYGTEAVREVLESHQILPKQNQKELSQ